MWGEGDGSLGAGDGLVMAWSGGDEAVMATGD